MNKYFLSAAAALLLGSVALAQDNKENSVDPKPAPSADARPKEKNKKLKEYDEIIIKRTDADINTKLTIEIKNDEVTVNGKPIEAFVDQHVVIMKRSPNIYKLMDPSSPFRFQEKTWHSDDGGMFDDGGIPKAFLGVFTEGTTGGAKVLTVAENSPASKAGLKKDDVIMKINDKEVFDQEQLTAMITEMKPEDKVTIRYKRNGKENTTSVALGAREKTRGIRSWPPHPPQPPVAPVPPMNFNFDNGDLGNFFNYRGSKPRLGIKAQDTEDGKGVKVMEVDEGSAAEKAGIKENDIITSFEGTAVNTAEELVRASRESKEKTSMKLQLNRNGKTQNIEVKVPRKLKTADL